MIDRAVGIAGLAVSIASLVLPSLFPAINRKIAWGGFACGIVFLVAAAGIAFFPDGEAQSPPAAQAPVVNQGPGSAYSSGQRGGITAGTVNIGPGSRHLSPTQKEELISDLRDKKVKLDLIYSLDQETASFATDFVDAFTMASVDFQKIIFGQTIPPQYGIFLYDPKGEAVELATALRNAKIPFMIAQSRAGTGPYPPQTPSLTIGLMPQN
jgi:hypothetical protein